MFTLKEIKMNIIYRSQVNSWLRSRDTTPLHFNFPEHYLKFQLKEKNLIDNTNITNLVLSVLICTDSYWSINKDNIFETDEGRARSVLDIWRHVKHYRPKTSIFTVMHVLANNSGQLVGQYCFEVERRVFHHLEVRPNMTLEDEDEDDEFDLLFYDWTDI
jgi:hypothetical protein